MDKLPPIEKVYEAFSAIADRRVDMRSDHALVNSSNGRKTYTVEWDGDRYTSNDNATYWQSYAGYPIIAVLILQQRLPLNRETAQWFAGIDWNELNTRHKRNSAKAIAEVMEKLKNDGADIGAIETAAGTVLQAIAALPITVKRSTLRPPK